MTHPSQNVSIGIVADNLSEPDESFTVVLSSPTGAVLNASTSTSNITIIGDVRKSTPRDAAGGSCVGFRFLAVKSAQVASCLCQMANFGSPDCKRLIVL